MFVKKNTIILPNNKYFMTQAILVAKPLLSLILVSKLMKMNGSHCNVVVHQFRVKGKYSLS